MTSNIVLWIFIVKSPAGRCRTSPRLYGSSQGTVRAAARACWHGSEFWARGPGPLRGLGPLLRPRPADARLRRHGGDPTSGQAVWRHAQGEKHRRLSRLVANRLIGDVTTGFTRPIKWQVSISSPPLLQITWLIPDGTTGVNTFTEGAGLLHTPGVTWTGVLVKWPAHLQTHLDHKPGLQLTLDYQRPGL